MARPFRGLQCSSANNSLQLQDLNLIFFPKLSNVLTRMALMIMLDTLVALTPMVGEDTLNTLIAIVMDNTSAARRMTYIHVI
jgi:hypothetical protein